MILLSVAFWLDIKSHFCKRVRNESRCSEREQGTSDNENGDDNATTVPQCYTRDTPHIPKGKRVSHIKMNTMRLFYSTTTTKHEDRKTGKMEK